MRVTPADRWGLELLSVEDFCPFDASDSSVRPIVADCLLTLQTTDAVPQSIVAPRAHGQSGGTPDSPVIFSGQAPRFPRAVSS
jgi:hypothetical protein